jgi:hypothetical protein
LEQFPDAKTSLPTRVRPRLGPRFALLHAGCPCEALAHVVNVYRDLRESADLAMLGRSVLGSSLGWFRDLISLHPTSRCAPP